MSEQNQQANQLDNPQQRQQDTDTCEQPYRRRTGDSVNIKLPWGSISISGAHVVTIILALALSSAGGWFLKTHEETTVTLVNEMKNMQYILLISQEKRDKIAEQITMPESLRKQLNR